MDNTTFPWYIGDLPFIYKPLSKPTNGEGIPDRLPFSLDVDTTTGTLIQVRNEAVEKVLSTAYSQGSEISGMMDDHGIGERYAQDFLRYLSVQFNGDSFKDKRVLEIGCGTGYLLSLLKQRGADVLGIEPGDQGQKGAQRFGIPIIQDFFPSKKISGTFDIIIIYGVLEHISSPDVFLKGLLAFLNDDGHIVISVPNCQPYIEVGDISFLLHEHWNYYTKETLKASLAESISVDLTIEESGFGGSLYAIGTVSRANVSRVVRHEEIQTGIKAAKNLAQVFRNRVQMNLDILSKHLTSPDLKKRGIGIFVPGRAVNILSLIDQRVVGGSVVRFFDDNKNLHNTYYPGFDIRVESRQALIESPPALLIIFSHTFGKDIRGEVEKKLMDTTILIWDDIFMPNRTG